MIMIAVIAYFRQAMKESSARLEPEQLLKNPWIIGSTVLTAALALWLLYSFKYGWFDVTGSLPPHAEPVGCGRQDRRVGTDGEATALYST